MRYLLMIYGPQWDPSQVSAEEQAASMEEWNKFTADLVQRGVMEAARLWRASRRPPPSALNGSDVLTTDGPFAETAEVLGGYYVLKVKDLDEAIGIAAACPGAKNGSIELRPITRIRRGIHRQSQRSVPGSRESHRARLLTTSMRPPPGSTARCGAGRWPLWCDCCGISTRPRMPCRRPGSSR